jgi:hypothetical protein
MFRHMVSILRGLWVPDKLFKQFSVFWACADYVWIMCGLWYIPCGQCWFHNNWPHGRVTVLTRPKHRKSLSSLSGTHDPLRMAIIRRYMSGLKKIWNVLITNPLLPGAFVGLFSNGTTRCSVQPSRHSEGIWYVTSSHYYKHDLSTCFIDLLIAQIKLNLLRFGSCHIFVPN